MKNSREIFRKKSSEFVRPSGNTKGTQSKNESVEQNRVSLPHGEGKNCNAMIRVESSHAIKSTRKSLCCDYMRVLSMWKCSLCCLQLHCWQEIVPMHSCIQATFACNLSLCKYGGGETRKVFHDKFEFSEILFMLWVWNLQLLLWKTANSSIYLKNSFVPFSSL